MKQNLNKQHIVIYWWNFGRKKKDFEGDILDFLKEKSIKVSAIKHPNKKEVDGTRFNMSIGSGRIIFDSFYNPNDGALTAIKLFLSYLGDRAQIHAGLRTYNIN
jgi:hypothetical protein